MTSAKFQFFLLAEGTDKTTSVVLKRIRSFDNETWFSFPEEYQKLAHHKSLMEIAPIKGATSVLKARGQYRSVNATLTEAVAKQYVDDDGNFVFKEHYLAETRFITTPTSSDPKMDELVSSLSKISESKEESVKDIMKHFLIEKFSQKNKNVEAWCDLFEKESKRFNLTGFKQIEVLKSCLDPAMSDWFSVNQRRLDSTAVWKDWKEKLISTFGDNSWKPIRYAYLYKYMSGSYIDYCVKKEKYLLELDRKLPDIVILDLIIVGLPSHVQNSLNKHTVTTIDILHRKLKKFESDVLDSSNKFKSKFNVNNYNKNFNQSKINSEESPKFKSKFFTSSNSSEKKTNNFVNKKACSFCASKGYNDRLHPETACWFKDKSLFPQKSVNNVEAESSLSEDETKN
ncbi:hypothetical protein V9T40_006737 [Parthenolecanium corni]|uniref:Uncharacterized protein n=1 Tax=Parthenolecanium corni TaxID=536013 RepID=A0AAN9TH57_9HEMI